MQSFNFRFTKLRCNTAGRKPCTSCQAGYTGACRPIRRTQSIRFTANDWKRL